MAMELAVRREAIPTAYEPQNLGELMKFAEWMSECDLLPEALRNKPKHFALVVIKGREIGFSMMQSVACINVIKGRAVVNAEGIVAKVLAHPDCVYFTLVESTDQVATYETLRRGAPQPVKLSYTLKQAQRAGLTGGNGTYQKHTEAMLRARCAMALGRAVYADAVLGLNETSEGEEIAARQPSVAANVQIVEPPRVANMLAPAADYDEPVEPAPPEALQRFEDDVLSFLSDASDKLTYEQAARVWLDNRAALQAAGIDIAKDAWHRLCDIVPEPPKPRKPNAELQRTVKAMEAQPTPPPDDKPRGGKPAPEAPAPSDDGEAAAVQAEANGAAPAARQPDYDAIEAAARWLDEYVASKGNPHELGAGLAKHYDSWRALPETNAVAVAGAAAQGAGKLSAMVAVNAVRRVLNERAGKRAA
jgi:hypothetical protein